MARPPRAGGAKKTSGGAQVRAILKRGEGRAACARARYTPERHPLWASASPEQREVCLQAQHSSLFVTGAAGTGKSFLLRIIAETTASIVTATTGTAALLVNGVTTFSALADEPDMPLHRWLRERSRGAFKALNGVTTFIIDEASMMSVAQVERLNVQLQVLGARISPERKALPFGGYRMVFFLDVTQLPPVDDPNRLICDAPAIIDLAPETVILTKMFRQTAPLLVHLAECTRFCVATPLVVLTGAVMERVAAGIWDIVDGMTASATRAPVHEINAQRMAHFAERVELPVVWEHGISGVGTYEVNGKRVDIVSVDTKKSRIPPPTNVIGINAPVRVLCNDASLRVANGMLGTLLEYDAEKGAAIIAVGDGDKRRVVKLVKRETYELCCKARGVSEPMIVKGVAVPIEGAFAITIHKAQGNTVPSFMRVDFGGGVLAPGLLYTGATRGTALKHFLPRGFLDALARARMHPSAEAFLRRNGSDTDARRHELQAESRALLPEFARMFVEETGIPVESLRFILGMMNGASNDLIRGAFPAWVAAGLGPLFTAVSDAGATR